MKSVLHKFIHNDFFNYLRMSAIYSKTSTAVKGKEFAEIIIIIINAIMTAVFVSMMSSGLGGKSGVLETSFEAFVIAIIFGASLSMGINRRKKPSIMYVAPVSFIKRALFAHLSCIIFAAFFIIFLFAFYALFNFLFCLIILAATGKWEFLQNFIFSTAGADGSGIMFCIFLFFIIFGSGVSISYIKKFSLRCVFMFAVNIALFALSLILVNVAAEGHGFVANWNVVAVFNELPKSWLWLAGVGAVALGICAVSVIFSIKSEKPKEF